MHIPDISAFKVWLQSKLQRICEADPIPLAQYVIALVRKDKTEKDLKVVCTEQLQVFLQDNTYDFINDLFNCLNTKSYITPDTTVNTVRVPSDDTSGRIQPTAALNTIPATNSGKSHHSSKASIPQERRRRRRSSGSAHSNHHRRSSSRSRSRSRSNSPHRRAPVRPVMEAARAIVVPTVSAPPKSHPVLPDVTVPPPTTLPRCPDFDERGFCLRGDSCMFDHGSEIVAVAGDALNSVLAYSGQPGTSSVAVSSVPPTSQTATALLPAYRPTPIGQTQAQFSQRAAPPTTNRNIVTVPLVLSVTPTKPSITPYEPTRPQITPEEELLTNTDPLSSQTFQSDFEGTGHDSGRYGGGRGAHQGFTRRPRGGRGFPRRGRGRFPGSRGPGRYGEERRSCAVLVMKIPWNLNTVGKLNEHFQRFGTITNIRICYEGDGSSALVEYASPAEAEAAYRSPDPILSNRFIRLRLHQPDQMETASSETASRGTTSQRGFDEEHIRIPGLGDDEEGSGNPTDTQFQQHSWMAGKDSSIMAQKKTEALRMIQQRKSMQAPAKPESLFVRYSQDLKALLAKYEQSSDSTEKKQLQATIKDVSRKMNLLNNEKSSNEDSSRGGYHARGGRGGAQFPQVSQTRLDKRPRTVYITGHLEEDAEPLHKLLVASKFVVEKFQTFDGSDGSAVSAATFATRKQGEHAISAVTKFRKKPLTLTFLKPDSLEVDTNQGQSDVTGNNGENIPDTPASPVNSVPESLPDSETVDDEERGWRR